MLGDQPVGQIVDGVLLFDEGAAHRVVVHWLSGAGARAGWLCQYSGRCLLCGDAVSPLRAVGELRPGRRFQALFPRRRGPYKIDAMPKATPLLKDTPLLSVTGFESRYHKVATRHVFATRMLRAVGLWFALIAFGLVIGIAGYAYFEGMSLDGFVPQRVDDPVRHGAGGRAQDAGRKGVCRLLCDLLRPHHRHRHRISCWRRSSIACCTSSTWRRASRIERHAVPRFRQAEACPSHPTSPTRKRPSSR